MDSAREGFIDGLKEKGYVDGENIEIDYENAKLIFEEVLLAGLGICYMIADNKCTFTEQDLNKYLGIAYRGAVLTVTTLNEDEYAVHPLNLIPCCAECNGHKSDEWANL